MIFVSPFYNTGLKKYSNTTCDLSLENVNIMQMSC